MSAQKSEFAMGWKVLLAGLVGVACGASPLPFNTIGFALAPLKEEYGWSYAQTSLSMTVYGITAALLAASSMSACSAMTTRRDTRGASPQGWSYCARTRSPTA